MRSMICVFLLSQIIIALVCYDSERVLMGSPLSFHSILTVNPICEVNLQMKMPPLKAEVAQRPDMVVRLQDGVSVPFGTLTAL